MCKKVIVIHFISGKKKKVLLELQQTLHILKWFYCSVQESVHPVWPSLLDYTEDSGGDLVRSQKERGTDKEATKRLSGPFPHRHLGPSVSSAGYQIGSLPCPWGKVAVSPPVFSFVLGYSCFTMLCWFLLYTSESAVCVHMSPPSRPAPCPSPPLSAITEQRAELRVSYSTFHEPSVSTRECIRHCSLSLSHPLHPLPVYMPVSVCASIPALLMSSSVPLFLDSTCMH